MDIQRAVKEEAGYLCGNPRCRERGPFDFEHIEPWSKSKEHKFSNIILLCTMCHSRVTRGEIEKSAVAHWKRNLAISAARYSMFEMRFLKRYFSAYSSHIVAPGMYVKVPAERTEDTSVDDRHLNEYFYLISGDQTLHVMGLTDDDLIKLETPPSTWGKEGYWIATLTEHGHAFLEDYFGKYSQRTVPL